MTDTYDPKSAFLGMKSGMRTMQAHAKTQEVPQGIVGMDGKLMAPTISLQAQTCCVLLLAFLNRAPMVPDDFFAVPLTKDGIEAYVRPDGAIYLGTFELPRDPGGAVMVWGDPALSYEATAAASIAYRQKLVGSFTEGSDLGAFGTTPTLLES